MRLLYPLNSWRTLLRTCPAHVFLEEVAPEYAARTYIYTTQQKQQCYWEYVASRFGKGHQRGH